MTTKVRKTVTLDEDIVEELIGPGEDPRALSPAINEALREVLDRRRRRRALAMLVAHLDETFGGAADPSEVEAFTQRYLLRDAT